VSFDAATVAAIFDAVKSKAAGLGVFGQVAGHEPKNAPGNGLLCSTWVDTIEPLPSASGLSQTSGRVVFHQRIYSNMLQEPQDDIDPGIVAAASALIAAYSADFTLGGTIREIDLLGEFGQALSAQAGYLEIDRKFYRVMVVIVPVIIDGMWLQGGVV
jgi:hypothetical protein